MLSNGVLLVQLESKFYPERITGRKKERKKCRTELDPQCMMEHVESTENAIPAQCYIALISLAVISKAGKCLDFTI